VRYVRLLIVCVFSAVTLPTTALGQGTDPGAPGVLFVVGGVGGIDPLPLMAQVVFPRAGVQHEIRNFTWSHGVGQVVRDLQDSAHLRRKGDELAEQVREVKRVQPNRPIYLLARSGGTGLAVVAAEQLGPGTVERIILLSTALSPQYDLRPALRATRGEIISFWSPHDRMVLGLGTWFFGTVDRVYGRSAGLTGFALPPGFSEADLPLYQRLVQIRWTPRMLSCGNLGGHPGTICPLFLACEVAPWLRTTPP
jgi:hypothetical protein